MRPTRSRRGNSEISVASGSEFYCSLRSESSDLQSFQHVVSTNRSPALVVPSPAHQMPLELVGLSSCVLYCFMAYLYIHITEHFIFLSIYCSDQIERPLGSCLTFCHFSLAVSIYLLILVLFYFILSSFWSHIECRI